MRQKAELAAIDAVALQLRYGAFELLRIVENCHCLTD